MRILLLHMGQVVNIVGGIEQVLANFANEMTKRGNEVSYAYCSDVKGNFCYPVNEKVKMINLVDFIPGHKFHTVKKPWIFKFKRECLRLISVELVKELNLRFELNKLDGAIDALLQELHPDIIISVSFFPAKTVWEADNQHKFPMIVMCHVNVQTLLRWISVSEKKVLNLCDAVQVLMPDDCKQFRKILPDANLICIPNTVPQYDWNLIRKEKLIVNVARLEKHQKRQDLLIKAFSKLVDQYPDWTLELWGDGNGQNEYADELNLLITKLHLTQRVKLCGRTNDVLSVYQRAAVFAFPSAFEGFPLAMTEAMSAGMPVVAYRSCPAVNKLIKDGETGLLVEDGVDALAEGLKKLMENEELRKKMGGAAHEAMKAFAPEKIWDQWEALMKEVIARHHTVS